METAAELPSDWCEMSECVVVPATIAAKTVSSAASQRSVGPSVVKGYQGRWVSWLLRRAGRLLLRRAERLLLRRAERRGQGRQGRKGRKGRKGREGRQGQKGRKGRKDRKDRKDRRGQGRREAVEMEPVIRSLRTKR